MTEVSSLALEPVKALLADSAKLEELRDEAVAWASVNGLMLGHDAAKSTFVHCPVSLLPSKVPKVAYNMAKDLAQDFNTLYDRVSRDYDFLMETLASSGKADPWLGRLLSILKLTHEEGVTQPITLGLHRSDYMFHTPSASSTLTPTSTSTSSSSSSSAADAVKVDEKTAAAQQELKASHTADYSSIVPLQVEFNTISTSFGCLSTKVTQLHRYLLSRFPSLELDASEAEAAMPENPALDNIANGLAEGVQIYRSRCLPAASSASSSSLAVVMVVQEGERNSADQRMIEYALWNNHRVPLLRRTMGQIASQATIDENKQLIIGEHIIAVSYFRAGYTPSDFKSEQEWDAVLLMERSSSIKCPSVAVHLSGAKKIQQHLAKPGVVERFVSEATAQRLRASFAGMWGLENDDEETREIIAKAITNPHDFVLKPQREGGGNNLWGEEIVEMLKKATEEERAAYILMQRIRPLLHGNVLMRAGELVQSVCASELGIYSTFIGDGKQELVNRFNGHNLRTKPEHVNEGGVAAGFATLDSPYFV